MTIDHIALAISETGIHAHSLGTRQVAALSKRLQERLSVNVASKMAWDSEGAPVGIHSPKGWELIPNYVGEAPCVLFQDEAKQMWEMRSGNDLLQLLKQCPPLELYVCNQNADYLLCSNHHDFLIGWGQAERWVMGERVFGK